MEIKVNIGDPIGYISARTDSESGKCEYRFYKEKLNKVVISKKGTAISTKSFKNFDYDELMFNTDITSDYKSGKGLIVINEPFALQNEEQAKHYESVVRHWNEHPQDALSIFDL